MVDRYAIIVTKVGDVNYFDNLVKHYDSHGIFLVRPHLNHVLLWTDDGPRTDSSVDQLRNFVKKRKHFTFAW